MLRPVSLSDEKRRRGARRAQRKLILSAFLPVDWPYKLLPGSNGLITACYQRLMGNRSLYLAMWYRADTGATDTPEHGRSSAAQTHARTHSHTLTIRTGNWERRSFSQTPSLPLRDETERCWEFVFFGSSGLITITRSVTCEAFRLCRLENFFSVGFTVGFWGNFNLFFAF